MDSSHRLFGTPHRRVAAIVTLAVVALLGGGCAEPEPTVDVHVKALEAARGLDSVNQDMLADMDCPPPPERRTGEAVMCRFVMRNVTEMGFMAVRVVDAGAGRVETVPIFGEIDCTDLPAWVLQLDRPCLD